MPVDLHCHTTASDGALSPSELLQLAIANHIELLAITDHDSLAGYHQAKAELDQHELHLLSGIELSSQWANMSVHVVGLNFDSTHPVMQQAVVEQGERRKQRAMMIAERLAKKGFLGAYDAAVALAGTGQVGRPHFAQFLVDKGYVSSIQQAFKRYLGAGKIGDVKAIWPTMAEVVEWIVAAGGVAVLAHPLHYNITATKRRALTADFKAAGGQAMEVVSGLQTPEKTAYLADLADAFELYASCGSDFHSHVGGWGDLGKMSPLPERCRPVWALWEGR